MRLSARLRILAWILTLTTLAVVGALLLSRRLLMQRLDAEVNDHLEQEVDEISQLVGGHDPATGQPFGTDVTAIFDTFLRRNVPGEGEVFYAFVDGRFHAASRGAPVPLGDAPEAGDRWAQLTGPTHGELDTAAGPVRWLALPLHDRDGRTLGVFVVASFLAAERQEIADVINTGLVVAGGVLVAAAVVGWVVAGRILRPIRELTDTARAIGAVNTLAFRAGAIEGDNTDAPGLLDAIGEPVAGRRCLVLGSGGAGRAAAWALREAGAEVAVWNRTPERAGALAAELGVRHARSAEPADVLVNSTTVGLEPDGDEEEVLAALGLAGSQPAPLVVDLVYGGEPTVLVRWAERAGSRAIDGVEVLVHQGARSLALWTGADPPLEVMKEAARHG